MKLGLIYEAYSRNSALESATKNRRVIKFYYAGPRKGQESVKAGNRFEVEPVAVGLTKKGNMAIKGWVNNTGSATKTGFEKHQWRTFLVSRMHMLEVTDDTFDEKRPGYKEGDDGSFKVTYVTSDWAKKPYRRKFEKELSRRKQKEKDLELQKQKEFEPDAVTDVPSDLPQPKQDDGPSIEPDGEVDTEPTPVPTPEVPRDDIDEPELDPEAQPQPEYDEDEEDVDNLHESIKRIKHLMLF